MGLERMLRMYVAPQCLGLSDEGTEDALYDSQAIRGFIGMDLSRESAPDATTLLKFRRLLEQHPLTERIFTALNEPLAIQVKNTAQLLTLFGLANLLIAKRRIWALHAQGAS
jgi:IS5 family transposase